ncbi:MAG: SDR family oxidoreductase, partial [Rhodospirillaceae bacterium]
MALKLKPLREQTMVITGASSGIGLTTARRAAREGARLVLASRNGEALQELVNELNSEGCPAFYVIADVAHPQEVENIARAAIERFGGFDTWVNNAGVSIYGRIEDVPLEDHRRLFDTNFWGVVHGSLTAIRHLKQRGGALINVGSEVSEIAIPLQGMYSASKHAVKGFTDALRVELQAEKAPVSVTLIKPAGIDTMFVPHAKNYMKHEPKLPAPVYSPDVVADAIVFAAQHAKRDIFVGGAARLAASLAHFAPGMTDRYLSRFMLKQQQRDAPARPLNDNALHEAGLGLHQSPGRP